MDTSEVAGVYFYFRHIWKERLSRAAEFGGLNPIEGPVITKRITNRRKGRDEGAE